MKKSIASRWWPELWRIALCPDRVVVARMGMGWRSRVLDKRVLQCPGESSADRPWQASIAALGAFLDEVDKPNNRVSVILSNHFVRYAIVPWRDSISNEAERVALARHRFKNIHGEVVSNWDVRISDGGFRRNALACAIDRELLIELDRLFKDKRVKLSSVQPFFMAACNRFRRELAVAKNGCFTVLERGRATVAIFDHAGWQVLSARRIGADGAAALPSLLVQEVDSANLAVPPEQLFIAALEEPRLEFAGREWKTHLLQMKARRGFSPYEDARYAMALCGAA